MINELYKKVKLLIGYIYIFWLLFLFNCYFYFFIIFKRFGCKFNYDIFIVLRLIRKRKEIV